MHTERFQAWYRLWIVWFLLKKQLDACCKRACRMPSRGSTGSTGSIRPGRERAKVVEHCTESEKSLNAPVHPWEERGGGESDTFLFLLSTE